MRAHILQHVAFEGPGRIADWLARRRADVGYTRFHERPELPRLDGLDLLVAMGGPMSVNDEAAHPWLVAEKTLLREAMVRGVPVLGVCLGAQLIASALGARVYPNRQPEIGWFEIERAADEADFPARARVFHWHGETFDLPPGARLLARSTACAHQAFEIGPRALALQFHLEVTPESLREMVAHGRAELGPAEFVQDEARILAAGPGDFAPMHALLDRLLARLVA